MYIENRYKCKHIIIPIGCDCHPAYMLSSIHLRKISLPFDWLNMALCRIEWVIELELAGEEVYHVDEVLDVSVASCPGLCELDL